MRSLDRISEGSAFPAVVVAAVLGVFAAVFVLAVSATAAGPLFVSARIDARMAPDGLERIVVEEYDGTLVLKGMVWEGTAAWYESDRWEDDEDDDENEGWYEEHEHEDEPGDFDHAGPTTWWDEDRVPVAEGKVTVRGILLTEGTADDFLGNPGILWLQYAFSDQAGASIGSAEGFVTLRSVGASGGDASFDGTVRVGADEMSFSGTGRSREPGFVFFRRNESRIAQLEAWRAKALAMLEEVFQARRLAIESRYSADPVGLQAALAELEAWRLEATAEIQEEYAEHLAEIDEETVDDSLTQWFGSTVLTARKPGFDFEAARQPSQVNRQFDKESRKLERARLQRLRVLRSVNQR